LDLDLSKLIIELADTKPYKNRQKPIDQFTKIWT